MGREIRRVPANWIHPKYPRTEKYEPMIQGYDNHLDDWLSESAHVAANLKKIMAGETVHEFNEDFTDAQAYYDEYMDRSFGMPKPRDFMPSGKWYQLYETVSEGTPLSAAYETAEQLKAHLTTKGDFWDKTPWSTDAVDRMFDDGFTPTAIFIDGGLSAPSRDKP